MRIAVVSPHLPTPAFPMRGVRHSEQLRAFARAGHAVRGVVPLPWAPGRGAPAAERDGEIEIAHPRYLRVPPRWRRRAPVAGAGLALEQWAFSAAARAALDRPALRPEVVLAHSAILPGGLVGRTGGAQLVVTMHDHELYELAPHGAWARRLLVQALRGADAVVYVSETLRAQGLALAGPHEARVVPIGIDTFDDLRAQPPAGGFTICCVTRLIPRKRVDRLIRAVGRLASELPQVRLRIAGDGPERQALVRLTSTLGLQEKIDFLGELDRRAALDEMARSSVMALPSVMESLGAVYFEAMSLGVPVLATAGEGIAAYIQSGVDGILVGAGDDEQLHAELRGLALDPARAQRIGAAGRQRFLASGPTWQANVASHLQLFDQLLRKTRGRR
jgi:glycosyltransferase involved in cell wall biosynthesis